jgi:arylformamidase
VIVQPVLNPRFITHQIENGFLFYTQKVSDFIDISMPIKDGMTSWPSDPDVSLKPFKTLEEKGSNVSELRTGTHFGTHVDAPKHNLADGAGVDSYDPTVFIGKAFVLDVAEFTDLEINSEHLAHLVPEGTERLLLKTRNSVQRLLEKPFTEGYVGLSADGAKWLADFEGLKVVGIDYLSIQRRGTDPATHTSLLERGIAILEGANLADVPGGEYELYCLPLRIADGDGAPARAVLKPL